MEHQLFLPLHRRLLQTTTRRSLSVSFSRMPLHDFLVRCASSVMSPWRLQRWCLNETGTLPRFRLLPFSDCKKFGCGAAALPFVGSGLEIDPERPFLKNSSPETKDFQRRNSFKTGFPDGFLESGAASRLILNSSILRPFPQGT